MPRMQPDASTTVKYRPVLPHTFGREDLARMTRAEKRAYARSLRKRGRPYKVGHVPYGHQEAKA